MMDYSLATDEQLKTIVQSDKDCPSSLLEGVAIEMIKRELWKGYIFYAAKQSFFDIKATILYTLQMSIEEFIHINHIEILNIAKKFQPGKISFKSYVILCLSTRCKQLKRDAEAVKRKANLYTEEVSTLDPKLQDRIFRSPVNVEKYVIDKITLENYLSQLNEIERKALYLEAMGYTQFEIAEQLGYHKKTGGKLIRRTYEKLRKMGA
jgi:RNA polymerase sigma factor (sigma-70 family)